VSVVWLRNGDVWLGLSGMDLIQQGRRWRWATYRLALVGSWPS
jgi:hypothetical protein